MPRTGRGKERGGLAPPLVAALSAVLAVLIGILAVVLFLLGSSRLEEGFEARGALVARSLAASVETGRTLATDRLGPSVLHAATGRGATPAPTQIAGFRASGPLRSSGGVSFREGELEGTPARCFVAPARDGSGAVVGFAAVVLSERELRSAKGTLGTTAVLLGLLVLGASIAASWGILSRVLIPLRRMASDVRGIAAGQYDRRVRALAGGEIARLATAVDEMARGLAAGRVIRAEHDEVGRELALGAEIQSSLLPDRIPMIAGVDIGAYYRPCGEVGGDYYDFIELPGGRLGLGVFDVSGHGVPSAIVMGMVRSLLHEVAPTANGPGATLRRLNKALHRDLRRGLFITAAYAELEMASQTLRVANAGHNPALVQRSATRKMESVKLGGPALGLAGAERFDKALREGQITLDLGDRVVLYTDGAVEITNAQGEQYGEPRFQGLVAVHATHESNAFINLLVEALETYRGEAPPEDDMTIITFAMTV